MKTLLPQWEELILAFCRICHGPGTLLSRCGEEGRRRSTDKEPAYTKLEANIDGQNENNCFVGYKWEITLCCCWRGLLKSGFHRDCYRNKLPMIDTITFRHRKYLHYKWQHYGLRKWRRRIKWYGWCMQEHQ